jgi:hypothetical protein
MGLIAGGSRPLGLMQARQFAQEGHRGRIIDMMREQEMLRLQKQREAGEAYIQTLPENLRPAATVAGPQAVAGAQIQSALEPPKDARTDDIKEYEAAVEQGYTGTLQDWILQGKKAGATTVSVGGAVIPKSSDLAVERLGTALTKGQSASRMINVGNNVRALLDEGVITGTGAEARLIGARASSTLGLSDPNIVARTETMRSQLAEAAIIARERLKGQGQITEGEQKMLDQAIARDPSMSEAGINQVLDLIERSGRADIAEAGTMAETIISLNEAELGKLRPAYTIKDPPKYRKLFDIDGMGKVDAKLGTDGKYYYTDPKTKKRYRVEE